MFPGISSHFETTSKSVESVYITEVVTVCKLNSLLLVLLWYLKIKNNKEKATTETETRLIYQN